MKISQSQIWLTAASWGSYIRAGDPGACMYGFSEDGCVQSEEHRAACLEYIDTECRAVADANIAFGECLDGHEELDALRAAIAKSPVRK